MRILKPKALVRKTFAIALEDLERLNQMFDSQFELSNYLREKIEEAYSNQKFSINYKMPRTMYEMPRTQKSIFLEEDKLQKYNERIKQQYGLQEQARINNRLSQVLTSLAHDVANQK